MPKSILAQGCVGLVVFAVAAVACTTSSGGPGSGGSGGGASSSSSTQTQTQSSVSVTTGGDPTTTPCSKNPCGANEACAVCHYSLSEGHVCHEKDAPSGGDFACDWLACGPSEACVHVAPAQDGCFEAACEPLPPACAETPECGCVEEALEKISPDGLYNYKVSSCAVEGGHASVTATVSP